jgi:hypothetical protein
MVVKSLLPIEECLTWNMTPSFTRLPDLLPLNNIWYDVFLVLALSSNALLLGCALTAPASG